MKRIIYCSQATHDLSPDELVSLLRQCRDNNEPFGVSGMLLYCSRSFLQLLDGETEAVQSTFVRIRDDDRHTSLRVLTDTDIATPAFPNWAMGFEHLNEERLAKQLPGFTPAIGFPLISPDLLGDADVALQLITLYAQNRRLGAQRQSPPPTLQLRD